MIGSRQGKPRLWLPSLETGEAFPRILSPVLSSWSSLPWGRSGEGPPHHSLTLASLRARPGQRAALAFLWCGEAGPAVPSLGEVSSSSRRTAP